MKNIVKQIITIPLVKVVLYIIKYRTITRISFCDSTIFYSSAIACCIFSTLVIFDIIFTNFLVRLKVYRCLFCF